MEAFERKLLEVQYNVTEQGLRECEELLKVYKEAMRKLDSDLKPEMALIQLVRALQLQVAQLRFESILYRTSCEQLTIQVQRLSSNT